MKPFPVSKGLLVAWLAILIGVIVFGFGQQPSVDLAQNFPMLALAVLLIAFWLGIVAHLLEQNKKLEAALKKSASLEEINRLKNELLSITSHELRTPLTPIKAQLQMALAEYFGPLTERQKQCMELVLRNTDHLDRLIGDIMAVSRLEAGTIKFDFKAADLNELIRAHLHQISPMAEQRHIRLMNDLGELPLIELDVERIGQVIDNLLSNALKFSPGGGLVTISTATEDHGAMVRVQDTGIGVDATDIAKLFKPFSQADSSLNRRFEGSGLGLAICKGIVHYHGGHISMRSQKGAGTVVSFWLPERVPVGRPPVFSFFDSDEKKPGGL